MPADLTANDRQRLPLGWAGLVALLSTAAFITMALLAGQDGNWDFYNYHFYNPYAFLNDRFWFDIMPAQRQTNISPFIDIPFYLLTVGYGIKIASTAYAVFQGLQAPAIFLVTYALLANQSKHRGMIIGLSLALTTLAVMAPLNLHLVGTTTGDAPTATLMLWAVCLFLLAQPWSSENDGSRQPLGLFACAGLLAGAAVGLKVTNGPFALALVLCAWAVKGEVTTRFKLFLTLGLAATAGFLVTYGYWGWFLYSEFQNPLFPTFNHVFQSGFMKAVQLNDETFKATSTLGVLFYPFLYNAYTGDLNYQQFFDLRAPVVYVSLVLLALVLLFSPGTRARLKTEPLPAGLLLFVLLSYVVWIQLFSITRYLLVLEVLAPLTVVATAGLMLGRHVRAAMLAGIALLPVLISSWEHSQRNNAFGYRSSWSETVFEIEFPDVDISKSMVIVTGGQAMAYLIPFAPQETRFVRIDSNINYVGYASIAERYDNRLGERLRQAIGTYRGPLFVILAPGEEQYAAADLNYFSLAMDESSCLPIPSKGPPIMICEVNRSP